MLFTPTEGISRFLWIFIHSLEFSQEHLGEEIIGFHMWELTVQYLPELQSVRTTGEIFVSHHNGSNDFLFNGGNCDGVKVPVLVFA